MQRLSMHRRGSKSASSSTEHCVRAIRTLLSYPEFAASCSSDRDLCQILSDGEVLCSLQTELRKSLVSPAASYYSTNSRTLAKQNVRIFLRQCSDNFGMDSSELFEPEDLLEQRNPELVVQTVNRLLVCGADANLDAGDKRSSLQLDYVMQEICDRERIIADQLMQLLLIRKELLGTLSEWSLDLVQVVFKHTEQLYSVHMEFHAKLTALADKGCEHFCQQLGRVFAEMVPRLEIYFQYFAHYTMANEALEVAFREGPELENQVNMLMKVVGKAEIFRSLYGAPIRQLTNYPTLFDRLKRQCAKEAPHCQESVAAVLSQATPLAETANLCKRQADQIDAAKRLLANVKGLPEELSKPAEPGQHLADGSFKVRRASPSKDHRESRDHCHCVLTTRHLVVSVKTARKQPQTYWFHIPVSSSLQVKKLDATSLEVTNKATGTTLKLEECKHGLGADKWIDLLTGAVSLCLPVGWDSRGHRFELTVIPSAGVPCSVCHQVAAAIQCYVCGRCSLRVHQPCLLAQQLTRCRTQHEPGDIVRRPAADYVHPGVDHDGANVLLMHEEAGTFLIRNSSSTGQVLCIKISSMGRPIHVRIVERNGRLALGENQQRWHSSLDELIDFYSRVNMSVHFTQVDCLLMNGLVHTE